MLVGLQRPAAALAAVADGVKAPEHGVLEEGVMNMTALVLGPENFYASSGVMRRERCGWCSPQSWQTARRRSGRRREAGTGGRDGPARTFQGHDVLWILQDDITGEGVRDDLLQIGDFYIFMDGHQLHCRTERDYFAMIAIGIGA